MDLTTLSLFSALIVSAGIAAFARTSSGRTWTFFVLGAITVLNLLYASMLSWVFRDGMGPDAIASTGNEAYRRAFSDFWIIVLIVCFPGVAALLISRFLNATR